VIIDGYVDAATLLPGAVAAALPKTEKPWFKTDYNTEQKILAEKNLACPRLRQTCWQA
jgi:hypothetical protein